MSERSKIKIRENACFLWFVYLRAETGSGSMTHNAPYDYQGYCLCSSGYLARSRQHYTYLRFGKTFRACKNKNPNYFHISVEMVLRSSTVKNYIKNV